MMRFGVLMAVVIVMGAAAAFIFVQGSGDPVHCGKPLSQWLDDGYEHVSMAVHEVGPAAVPVIFQKLRSEHPVYGWCERYRKSVQRLPSFLRRCLPEPRPAGFDDLRGCSALVDIGPAVIPQLESGLRDRNPAVRLSCAWALGVFAERGVGIDQGLWKLQPGLQDPDPAVRARAEWALSRLKPVSGPQPRVTGVPEVIPIFGP